jgi:putative SOS response-associated peptidase YedK
MCGRYVSPDVAAMERYWELKHPGSPFAGVDALVASGQAASINYNTAPTRMVPVERIGTNGAEIVLMRWGMDRIESDGKIASRKLNNARAEGYKRVPPFAQAWRKGQRAIQLVMGYYEWMGQEDGRKLPFYIRPGDQGETFGLAALWDHAADGSGLFTVTHITMPPNAAIARIHDRMPAILRAEDHDAWLQGTPEQAAACIKPYPDEFTIVRRVSTKVNSTRNNGPELIEPDL